MYVDVCLYSSVCMGMYVCIRVYACGCVSVFVCMYVDVCLYSCVYNIEKTMLISYRRPWFSDEHYYANDVCSHLYKNENKLKE